MQNHNEPTKSFLKQVNATLLEWGMWLRVQEGATDTFTKIFKANKISLHNVLMNELVVCQTT